VIRNLARVLLVAWAGSLWSLAWVTWILFHAQNDRHLPGAPAGPFLAGPLFTIETCLGLGAAALALLLPGRGRFLWGYVAAALLALNEWGLRRVMDAAHAHGAAVGFSFGTWHGVSVALYLAASLAVLVLIWKAPVN
jgi:hypothetical protein